MLDFLISLDIKLFYLINHFRLSILDFILPIFSEPRFLYIFYSFTSVFLFFRYPLKKLVFIYLMCIIGFLWVDFSCARILKPFFCRKRPFMDISKTFYYSKKNFNFLNKPVNKKVSFSFPSNHASNTAFTSFFLSFFFPKLSILWISFALMVGWSRIYLGVHFPSDVLCGFFYGFLWAFIFYQITKKLLNKL